jgi:Protein of unknown function (DUF2807).
MKLTSRVWIVALAILFTQANTQAQFASYNGKKPIVVTADDIRGITVKGNIAVILQYSSNPGTFVHVETKSAGKLKAWISGDELYLDTKPSAGNEQVVVKVLTNNLGSLTLRENSYAWSQGVLDLEHFKVHIHDNARVAIRTRDRSQYTAPSDHTFISDEKNFSVTSADRK